MSERNVEFGHEWLRMAGYAVDVRYPDIRIEPSREEAQDALAIAEEVVEKVAACIQRVGEG